MDKFTRQYFETALWSSTDNADDSGGEPLDKNYSTTDINDETRDKMIADCADFQERFGELYTDSEQAGHDFWLSRNGHGAGFFDGDEERRDELQAAAESYGQFDLYIGDDGEIHGTPLDESGVGEARGHRVSDFNTLPELIEHARKEGATHVLMGHKTWGDPGEAYVYFPSENRSRPYLESRIWQENGYWHTEAPGKRTLVARPPEKAQPIGSHARRGAAEPSAGASTTKPGKHGPLYLYEVTYTDPSDDGIGQLTQRIWAYNLEHAEEKFYEAPDAEGWRIVSLARVPEGGSMHRAKRHQPMREHAVRDYIAVDKNDRRVAGPFKSRHEADSHVPPGGHIKFAPSHRRGPPPAPSSYPMFRESSYTIDYRKSLGPRVITGDRVESDADGKGTVDDVNSRDDYVLVRWDNGDRTWIDLASLRVIQKSGGRKTPPRKASRRRRRAAQ